MPRIYRRDIDSSTFITPRTFTRVFCERPRLAVTVLFYEALTHEHLDQDIDLPETGMRMVAIGGFLLLVLDSDKAAPERYESARNTTATIIVPFLNTAVTDALAMGAEQVGKPFSVPHARGCRLRHPDGLVVEYLEHRSSPFDAPTPGAFA